MNWLEHAARMGRAPDAAEIRAEENKDRYPGHAGHPVRCDCRKCSITRESHRQGKAVEELIAADTFHAGLEAGLFGPQDKHDANRK